MNASDENASFGWKRSLNGHSRCITALALGQHGMLASASLDGAVRLWNVSTGARIGDVCTRHRPILDLQLRHRMMNHEKSTTIIESAEFEDHSNDAISDSPLIFTAGADGTCRVWIVRTFDPNLSSSSSSTSTYSSRSRRRSTLIGTMASPIIQTMMGRCVRTFRGHEDWVRCLQVDGRGDLILTGGDDGRVNMWSVRAERQIGSIAKGAAEVNSVSLSSNDGNVHSNSAEREYVAVAEANAWVRLHDFHRMFEASATWPTSCDVTNVLLNNEQKIVHAGLVDGSIECFCMRTNRRIIRWSAHDNSAINRLRRHGRNLIASASSNGEVKLWTDEIGRMKLENREDLHCIWNCEALLESGSPQTMGDVWDVSMVVDTSRKMIEVASGGVDQTIQVWAGKCPDGFLASSHMSKRIDPSKARRQSIFTVFHPSSAKADMRDSYCDLKSTLELDITKLNCDGGNELSRNTEHPDIVSEIDHPPNHALSKEDCKIVIVHNDMRRDEIYRDRSEGLPRSLSTIEAQLYELDDISGGSLQKRCASTLKGTIDDLLSKRMISINRFMHEPDILSNSIQQGVEHNAVEGVSPWTSVSNSVMSNGKVEFCNSATVSKRTKMIRRRRMHRYIPKSARSAAKYYNDRKQVIRPFTALESIRCRETDQLKSRASSKGLSEDEMVRASNDSKRSEFNEMIHHDPYCRASPSAMMGWRMRDYRDINCKLKHKTPKIAKTFVHCKAMQTSDESRMKTLKPKRVAERSQSCLSEDSDQDTASIGINSLHNNRIVRRAITISNDIDEDIDSPLLNSQSIGTPRLLKIHTYDAEHPFNPHLLDRSKMYKMYQSQHPGHDDSPSCSTSSED